LSWKILDRKTGRVKFDRYIVIMCELMNRHEVLDNRRCDMDIIQLKGRCICGYGSGGCVGDTEPGTIANTDRT
jgi:hypothetical protein